MGWYQQWRPYVPVAKRRANAAKFAQKLAKQEKRALAPVNIAGRKIATTFWGQAWMDNLERYSDFANRLPRGRTYVRNGSVIDLVIRRGEIKAIVSGSEIYQIKVTIDTLAKAAWTKIKHDCAHSIESMIDLLGGRFDDGVMQRLTRREGGLFPQPNEIKLKCSCPDWATLCKHVAAVMYGIGARLDAQPELLFTLRAVDHTELIQQATTGKSLDRLLATSKDAALGSQDLGELFGIELDEADAGTTTKRGASPKSPKRKPAATSAKAKRGRASVAVDEPSETKRRRVGATVKDTVKDAAKATAAPRTGKKKPPASAAAAAIETPRSKRASAVPAATLPTKTRSKRTGRVTSTSKGAKPAASAPARAAKRQPAR